MAGEAMLYDFAVAGARVLDPSQALDRVKKECP